MLLVVLSGGVPSGGGGKQEDTSQRDLAAPFWARISLISCSSSLCSEATTSALTGRRSTGGGANEGNGGDRARKVREREATGTGKRIPGLPFPPVVDKVGTSQTGRKSEGGNRGGDAHLMR